MSVTETGQSEIPNKDGGCNAVTDTRVITDYRQSEIPSGAPNAPGFGAEGWKKDGGCNAVTDSRVITDHRQSEISSGVPNAPGFGAEGWKKDAGCNAVTDSRAISQPAHKEICSADQRRLGNFREWRQHRSERGGYNNPATDLTCKVII